MIKKTIITFCFLIIALSPQKAKADIDTNAVIPIINYIPNRVVDFTDIFNIGLSIGPTFGLNFTYDDYVQLGYISYSGTGYTWLGRDEIRNHKGFGENYGIGLYRYKSDEDQDSDFLRNDYRLSAEVGLGLIRLYGALKLDELLDFFLGFVFVDLKADDEKTEVFVPFSKLTRGIKNVAFGALEIPYNIFDAGAVTETDGYIVGPIQGISRFIQRELVGLYEIATFFLPGEPIIYPEAPFESPAYEWEYNWD